MASAKWRLFNLGINVLMATTMFLILVPSVSKLTHLQDSFPVGHSPTGYYPHMAPTRMLPTHYFNN